MIEIRRALRTGVAIVATALFPIAAVAPASAAPLDFSALTVDCLEDFVFSEFPGVSHALHNTATVEITLTNCDVYQLKDLDNTSNASNTAGTLNDTDYREVDGDPDTIDVSSPVTISFYEADTPIGEITIYEPGTLPNPDEGVFLGEGSQYIGDGATDFNVAGTPESPVDLGNVGGCGLMTGDHVYASQKFVVKTAGTFTFRVTSTDPQSNWAHHNAEYTPMEDSFLLMTKEFDESNPGENVVGCDDDLWGETIDGLERNDRIYVTDDGQLYQRNQPYMVTDLEPGNYTLVFTYWGHISAADWASGTSVYGDWEPIDGTFNFDVWGPEGSLELVDSYPPSAPLASTGVEPALALWSGLALAGTGVAITVARRRANRA